jgi:hypothetical protein
MDEEMRDFDVVYAEYERVWNKVDRANRAIEDLMPRADAMQRRIDSGQASEREVDALTSEMVANRQAYDATVKEMRAWHFELSPAEWGAFVSTMRKANPKQLAALLDWLGLPDEAADR